MTYDPRYAARWRYDRLHGRLRQIDGREVRQHIDMLMAQGASYAIIGAAAGESRQTVRQMRENTHQKVTASIAEKILRLDERIVFAGGRGSLKVPKYAAVRRIQALLAMGYTHAYLTERLGLSTNHLISAAQAHATKMLLANHRRIAALYDELHMTPGPSAIGAQRARKRGYAPPLAWNDIDDPHETPEGVAA